MDLLLENKKNRIILKKISLIGQGLVTGIGKTVLQIKYITKLLDKKLVIYYFITCQFILLQLTDFFKLSIFIRVILSAVLVNYVLAIMHIISYLNVYVHVHIFFSPSSTDPVYAYRKLNLF